MNVSDWQDRDETVARLVSANMRPACAEGAAQCFVKAAAAIREAGIGSSVPVVACWVPGRIEVLGKHTDYCGGESILATAERGFCMIASPRDDSAIHIIDARKHQSIDFRFTNAEASTLGIGRAIRRPYAVASPGIFHRHVAVLRSRLPAICRRHPA